MAPEWSHLFHWKSGQDLPSMGYLKSVIAYFSSQRKSPIRSIRFSLDGQFMAVAEPADFVNIYSTKSDYKMRQQIDFFGEITGISLSPDDESLFIGVWDRSYASLLHYNRKRACAYLDSIV